MKKLYTFLAAILLTTSIFAQAPEGFNYQALARDSAGDIIVNTTIAVQFDLRETTLAGTIIYTETHSPTTNENGVFNLVVGQGTLTFGVFNTIDWATDSHFLEVSIDPANGTAFNSLGTTQLLSVPYALHAKTVTQPTYNVNTFYAELGGYVIEVNSDGSHGLVVAMQDQGVSSWYQANDLLSNASKHDTNGAKFKDWRMPTRRELNLMYVVYNNGNGATLNANSYWTSMENLDNGDNAWIQDFSNDGFRSTTFKYTDEIYVRVVRAF